SQEGFVVIRNGEVPVVDEFDLESSQMATKRVDLQPYFVMGKPGRYKVTATVRFKEWSLTVSSAPKHFDVINVAALGPLVSFSSPEAQVDQISQLHVLWQTGAQSFSYTIISPDGSVVSRDIYDN